MNYSVHQLILFHSLPQDTACERQNTTAPIPTASEVIDSLEVASTVVKPMVSVYECTLLTSIALGLIAMGKSVLHIQCKRYNASRFECACAVCERENEAFMPRFKTCGGVRVRVIVSNPAI